MTDLSDLSVPSAQWLAGIAITLLVFVSGGVIYLSAVEWRDRRRRKAPKGPATVAKRAGAKAPNSNAFSPKRAVARPGKS